MSFQQIIFTGNLGKDPELRYTPQGVAVCDFNVAVNNVRGSGDERVEKVQWFKVTAWRQSAEACTKFLKTGSQVLVNGRLTVEDWKDRDGNPRYTLAVQAERVEFLNNTVSAEERGEREAVPSHTSPEVQSAFHDAPAVAEDDFS